MKEVHPSEVRKSLEIVQSLKTAGIDFVPIPVLDENDKSQLTARLMNRLETILETAENEEKQKWQ